MTDMGQRGTTWDRYEGQLLERGTSPPSTRCFVPRCVPRHLGQPGTNKNLWRRYSRRHFTGSFKAARRYEGLLSEPARFRNKQTHNAGRFQVLEVAQS